MFVYIKDIVDSIELIEKYLNRISYKKFEEKTELQDAVLRRFEIISEAATRLTEEFKDNSPMIPWKSIVGLRNIIIHDYASINLKEIWKIATVDLIKTKGDIKKLKK